MPTQPNKNLIIEAKRVRLEKRAKYSKEDDRRRYTVFGARVALKGGTYLLSNLAGSELTVIWPPSVGGGDRDALQIPAWLCGRECRYDTSEHAYQALRCCGNLESAKMFESGGIVSMEIFRAWPAQKKLPGKDLYAQKMKQWGIKGPGIAAKMVSTLDPGVALAAFGMTLVRQDEEIGFAARRNLVLRMGPAKKLAAAEATDPERRSLAYLEAIQDKRDAADSEFERRMQERMETVELGVWGFILSAKFSQNSDARAVLLGTKSDILIERARMPRQGDYWGAFVQADGRRIGGNMMGRLLMWIREEAAALLRL